ncbi:replication factor C, subunit RFC4 [Hanseniaspora valbyensis NRRL Y-1626]|uniref:Replication factor C, subunit RFC4 n=1 Tax=Hanseniaspora valbyensis NRRL Y-1626 TaxID=766949 RepID=A0A1B7THF6_9ASCO|nr:replication factor C, subunit RFC4 [Hanseniaspora valbyensis NRRL Y-1626]
MSNSVSNFFNNNKRQKIKGDAILGQNNEDDKPWVEKYRPQSLDDVTSQKHVIKQLQSQLNKDNLPHLLFHGPAGTGKTSTILALSKQLYGPQSSPFWKSRVLELNASDDRGISIVRDKIKTFATLTISNPSKKDLENFICPSFKIIILDEADSMTADAQAALRRTMELYSNVTRFVIVCNYVTKIIDPLKSRCTNIRFNRLDNEDSLNRLKYIVEQEHLKINEADKVLEQILENSKGDLRRAITLLQSASKISSVTKEEMNSSLINELTGKVDISIIAEFFNLLRSKNVSQITQFINKELIQKGFSSEIVIQQLHDYIYSDTSNDANLKADDPDAHWLFFETDCKLVNGGNEYIQLLNFALQLSKRL